jgi:hypothetical protein
LLRFARNDGEEVAAEGGAPKGVLPPVEDDRPCILAFEFLSRIMVARQSKKIWR